MTSSKTKELKCEECGESLKPGREVILWYARQFDNYSRTRTKNHQRKSAFGSTCAKYVMKVWGVR